MPSTIILSKSKGRLGITCENHPSREGALVSKLVEHSAAAGLKVGDLIVAVNHYPVQNHKECIQRIDEAPDVMKVDLDRPTRTLPLDKSLGRVGITCFNAASGVGVVIASLVEGSVAREAGLNVGDTVLTINERILRTHEEAVELIDTSDSLELVTFGDTRVVELAKGGNGKKLGLTVTNNPESAGGVVVAGLVRGGLASNFLQLGDVIIAVDEQIVNTHQEAIALVDNNPDLLTLLVGPKVHDLERMLERATSFGRSKGTEVCEVEISMGAPLGELNW